MTIPRRFLPSIASLRAIEALVDWKASLPWQMSWI